MNTGTGTEPRQKTVGLERWKASAGLLRRDVVVCWVSGRRRREGNGGTCRLQPWVTVEVVVSCVSRDTEGGTGLDFKVLGARPRPLP